MCRCIGEHDPACDDPRDLIARQAEEEAQVRAEKAARYDALREDAGHLGDQVQAMLDHAPRLTGRVRAALCELHKDLRDVSAGRRPPRRTLAEVA